MFVRFESAQGQKKTTKKKIKMLGCSVIENQLRYSF